MSLIAVTSSQGFSVLPSSALRASHPDPAPTITTALTPPSRIPSPCISWSPDASTIYVASGGSVSAYNPSGSFIRDVVREGEGGIGGAKLGTMVVLQTQSGTDPVLAFSRGARAVVFDSETRRALQTVEGHRSSITTMSLAQDQSLLATSSGETTVITNLVQQTNTVLRNAPPGVVAVAFHPAKRSTLLILSPRGLHVFDTAKGNAPTRTIPIGKAEGGAGYIAFSPITPALVAVLVPGSGTRVLMLDIEKESSLVKKFTVEENVSVMSFSHDGGSIIVGTEVGRVLQLNLRSMDKPAQAVAVDPTRGRIGGLSLAVGPTPQLARTMSSSTATTAPVTGTRPLTRPTRAESVTSTSTGESVRVRSSVDPRTPAIKLRSKPSVDVLAKSPDALRGTTTKTPETLRKRASSADLLGKTSLAPKTSPGALRVKAGVESKPRPTSMIVATSARERTGTRVRPVSVVEEKSGDVAGKSSRGANASPVAVASAIGESPMRDKSEKESTVTPTLRRQTQTMPRRLTTDGAARPSLAQVFAQDDLGTSPHTRSRSTSYSAAPASPAVPLSAGPILSSDTPSQNTGTPISARPALVSTTPSYTPGPGVGMGSQAGTTTPSYSPEERAGGRVTLEQVRERPLSRLSEGRERTTSRLVEERARSRLGNDVIEEEQPIGQDRVRPRIVTDGAETDRERPASRLFRDEIERPSSRVGGILGLGRPSGTLARRFSTTELTVTPETMRIVSDSGVSRERASCGGDGANGMKDKERPGSALKDRPESVLRERPENLRERPQSVLRERPESIFRERTDSGFRDRPRSGTPLSASGRTPGKRVGWIDEESPYVEGVHDTSRARARTPPMSGRGSDSGSPGSSDSGRAKMLQVTPRRGLAAALGAEVYAEDAPTGGKGPHGKSTSLTQAQAQDLLRNIVSDVMFEFRQEAKEDVRGLHLDLIRASRGWKNDLKQYLGETLDELREVKEENARLRAEIARLKRGH
ncbi:hypothetical protein FS749_003308 [Ceratobasidium sp. UAMH 11750]|nr:hypothetical protein FS749_003308 [Ceratobasidium sp. UAMH 11750]